MKFAGLMSVVVLAIVLSGCDVSVQPKVFPGGAVGGQVKVKGDLWNLLVPFAKGGDKSQTSLVNASLSAGGFDAAQLSVDLSGTTIPLPASGVATVQLTYEGSDVVRTQAQFSVIRSGSILKFANSAAVNAWILNTVADGDEVQISYEAPDTSSVGTNTLSMAVVAEGVTFASSEMTWYRSQADYTCRNCQIP